jgi:putative membrane protein
MVADPRTLQANERTLLAWLRTGVSLITFGFFIARLGLWLRFQTDSASPPRSTLVGGALVLMGAITETIGLVRYVRVRRALLAHRPVPIGATEVVALTVVVALLGFYMAVHLAFVTKVAA